MTPATRARWVEANQRSLMAAADRILAALTRHAGTAPRPPEEAGPGRDGAGDSPEAPATDLPAPSALDTLCAAFGLSPFERDVLLCCAGVELSARFAAACAAAHGDPGRMYPTFGLALAALPDAHWSALLPTAPLRRWRLIELGPGDSLTAGPLRIDERVLHYLTGLSYLDRRLREIATPVEPPGTLPSAHAEVARRLDRLWSPGGGGPAAGLVHLCGPDPDALRAIAAAACAALGLRLHAARAAELPPVTEQDTLARLWEREAVLSGTGLLLECEETTSPEALRAAASFAERLQCVVAVAGREPLRPYGRPAPRVDAPGLSAAEQRALWQQGLGSLAPRLDGQLDRLVAQFNLGHRAIQAASAQVRACAGADVAADPGQVLWESCRAHARPRLDGLAQRLEPSAGWGELVLPAGPLETLREITAHVRQRARVHGEWGFAAWGGRGLGTTALFAGASGTGKTLAAEVLAHELRLDLYRIDLSQVVSKYIGETEKNLRRVFEAAEEGGAILLFDEADALFGRRSEVKDSHDRYANIEVSYLLQRMEAYRGLAILTTNMKAALDPAFLRRIQFVVQFPFPDAAQRAEIWRHVFPPAAPTEALDVARLSRLNVAGGNIRAIALNAAFLAADAGEPVRMAHLLRATRGEYAKLEQPLLETEIGGWT